MKMELHNVNVWQPDGTFQHGSVCMQDGYFTETSADGITVDGNNAYAIPGLVDLHFHGAVGHDVSDGSAEGLQAICDYELSQGVTTICPATMSLGETELLQVMEVVKGGSPTGASLAGIHMEGPFFSHAKKGAQNGEYLRNPQISFYKKLQEVSGNAIRIVSLAPELEGAAQFAAAVKDQVVLSVAHTDASYEVAKAALEGDFTHVTHFYNGMTPLSHRAPGVVGAALECDGDFRLELICDGIHLHPGAVRLAFKVLGKDRIIFISDTMRAVGLADGQYTLGGQAVTVKGPEARLIDGTIAGSATNLLNCLRTAVVSMDIDLGTAVLCASANPAKELGLYDKIGSIEPGKVADLVLLQPDLGLQSIYHNGQKI